MCRSGEAVQARGDAARALLAAVMGVPIVRLPRALRELPENGDFDELLERIRVASL